VATFPFSNWLRMSMIERKEEEKKERGSGSGDCSPYITSIWEVIVGSVALTPKLLICLLCWWCIDLNVCKTFELGWSSHVFIRDFVIVFVFAYVWDWSLRSSPLKNNMSQKRFNPKLPTTPQVQREIALTLCSSVISSVFEISLLYYYATSAIHYSPLFSFSTLLWALTMYYWRITHFYVIHRALHPWFPSAHSSIDPGKLLYKYVHSYHHLSRNPTAWSGISMHPVESSLYYSAMLIPVAFSAHPFIFLFTKLDLTMGALAGHDGYSDPGAGSYFHYLHHKYVSCNYGDLAVPLDWLFGTYYDGKGNFTWTK
jgi:Delta7-sterol 5-desaturase